MHYLRNSWYAAALASEVTDIPLGRVLLGEKIVFFRDSKGGVFALQNRCPHRFAPLSMGKVQGDALECTYHGLRFGAGGECVLNPHGNKQIPNGSSIKHYPAAERDGFIWFWPGDPARADASLIPSFPEMSDTKNFTPVFGYLHTIANYELVIDNLLDLSHVEFLHPMFQQPDGVEAHKTEFKQDGNVIHAMRWKPNTAIHGLAGNLYWTSPSKRGDARAHMRWSAPSILHFDLGVTEVGAPEADGICLPNAHLVTPEDEFNSHYFWSIARNRKIGDEDASQQLFSIVNRIFATEDLPIIEAQQENMNGSSNLMAQKPVSLEPDIPAVRARRILQQLIADEQGASAAQAAE
jgi:phenylpropionate dioxygenase-like ring-hydroxylating dioxygenase large terminal subunit